MLPNNYNLAAAIARIDELIENGYEHNKKIGILSPSQWKSSYELGDVQFTTSFSGDPPSYRMATLDDEEFIFCVTGAIVDTDFAPFYGKTLKNKKVARLLQSVTINGLASQRFSTEIYATQDILTCLAELAPLRVDLERNPAYSTETEFSCRFFTPRDDLHEQNKVEISDLLDPRRVLRKKAADLGLVHTQDNSVLFKKYINGGYVDVSPGSFRPGDIVDVHFSCALVRTHDEILLPKLLLRAVISRDESIASAACSFTAPDESGSQVKQVKTLKRKRCGLEAQPVRNVKMPRHGSVNGQDADHGSSSNALGEDVPMSGYDNQVTRIFAELNI